MTSERFRGKVVIVTGGGSGIGRATALGFAREGAAVAVADLAPLKAEAVAAEARALGARVLALACDVSRGAACEDAVRATESALGPLDVLVNNAGIGITSPVEVQDMEATRLIFDTNVFGCHRMARAVLPGMRARKSGQLFQISSQLGRVIVPYSGHYSATKFALEAMSEQLAYELVPHNIDVTIIEPGGYPTEVWVNRNAYSQALKGRAGDIHTAGYPEQVARMGMEDGSGRSADPMDVPREIARLIAMPQGTRPLRLPVHPGPKPQTPINEVTAKVQVDWLGRSPAFGPLVRAVHEP